jgi:hypothetical protein
MKTHTPGPWLINESAEITNVKYVLGRIYCGDTFPSGNDEWDANCMLIAAAPEMLEALEAALVTLKAFLPEAWATVNKVEEAINKAKGL